MNSYNTCILHFSSSTFFPNLKSTPGLLAKLQPILVKAVGQLNGLDSDRKVTMKWLSPSIYQLAQYLLAIKSITMFSDFEKKKIVKLNTNYYYMHLCTENNFPKTGNRIMTSGM